MKPKVIWPKVVDFVLEELIISQKELAEYCGVTQQCVSNWKISRRAPGSVARRKLFECLKQNGIRLSLFYDEDYPKVNADPGLDELRDIYMSLPYSSRETLLEFARFAARKESKGS
ncbi:MAG: hypothetical protein JW808_02915 [Victivallales bacterium]|nr:hypothetical protein [Victivallales bacterium]